MIASHLNELVKKDVWGDKQEKTFESLKYK